MPALDCALWTQFKAQTPQEDLRSRGSVREADLASLPQIIPIVGRRHLTAAGNTVCVCMYWNPLRLSKLLQSSSAAWGGPSKAVWDFLRVKSWVKKVAKLEDDSCSNNEISVCVCVCWRKTTSHRKRISTKRALMAFLDRCFQFLNKDKARLARVWRAGLVFTGSSHAELSVEICAEERACEMCIV